MLDNEFNRPHQLIEQIVSSGIEGVTACKMEVAAHLSANRTILAHAAFWCRLSLQSSLAALACDSFAMWADIANWRPA